jgi:hypothetical protein
VLSGPFLTIRVLPTTSQRGMIVHHSSLRGSAPADSISGAPAMASMPSAETTAMEPPAVGAAAMEEGMGSRNSSMATGWRRWNALPPTHASYCPRGTLHARRDSGRLNGCRGLFESNANHCGPRRDLRCFYYAR